MEGKQYGDIERNNNALMANKDGESKRDILNEESISELSSRITQTEAHSPYDKGWAWMVTLGAFVVLLLVPGWSMVIAILLPNIIAELDTSMGMIGAMQSVCSLAYCVTSQLTMNLLLTRMSVRQVTVMAACVNATATLLIAAFPSMTALFVLNIVKFCSQGCMLAPAMTHVGVYFRRRRAFASAVSLLGVSCGAIVMPPLVTWLRAIYGFRWCFVMISGLEMQGIVAASLFRPLPSPKPVPQRSPQTSESETDTSSQDDVYDKLERNNNLNSSLVGKITTNKQKTVNFGSAPAIAQTSYDDLESVVGSNTGDNAPRLEFRRRSSTVSGDISTHEYFLQKKFGPEKSSFAWLRNMDISSSFMASSINLQANKVFRARQRADIHNLNDNDTTDESPILRGFWSSCVTIFKSMVDFSVLKDWDCFSNVFAYVLARSAMFVSFYVPYYAIQLGQGETYAALLVTVYGGVDMVSRLMFGFIGDFNVVRPKYIIAASSVVTAVLCCFGRLFVTFETLMFFCGALGLVGGVTLSLNTINIVDMAGARRLGPLLSMGSLGLSLFCTAMFPITGFLIEWTSKPNVIPKNYPAAFYLVAVCYIASAVLLLSRDVMRMLSYMRTHIKCCFWRGQQDKTLKDNIANTLGV